MAIVEDEVRNGSEGEDEIEVVVEEEDGDQDSDDSDDDDDDDVEDAMEKVNELERRIEEDHYNYDDHISLIQALWRLSDLDRWRAAFDRLQNTLVLRPEHWLLRIQTEESLAHTSEAQAEIVNLFKLATLDCYSISILSEWYSWSLSINDVTEVRGQLEEVLRRAGADPLSGKAFWDARYEMEKAQLEAMSEDDSEYETQKKRVLWCLEETLSRPLIRGEEVWQPMEELALQLYDQEYVDKIKKIHEVAVEYLQKITGFEDKLLVIEDVEEKYKMYQEYIDTVKDLAQNEKYSECDSNGILKVLYDRATTECLTSSQSHDLLLAYARHVQRTSSRETIHRVLDSCTRRCPRRSTFWVLKMQQAEHENKEFDEVKTIFETALSKGMDSYKQAESLWLSYCEYTRRKTTFDNEPEVERLRSTFRLAWDSLAEAWGEEANDCEVPLFWARLEYKRMKDPKQGKEIFEEIFKYGENKTLSKYWEALIHLEKCREPPANERRLRELHRRALRSVTDYPPTLVRLWTDFERDTGELQTMLECSELCQAKVKEWRDNYQAMKEKMTGQKQKGKQSQNKKGKIDKRKQANAQGKRKSGETPEGSDVKRKREGDMEVEESEGDKVRGSGTKRRHDDDDEGDNKRQRKESTSETKRFGSREACTLFVSNLDFKVDEKSLREKLSEFGKIVSMRVKAGVKAFGGSICYCQYETPESVDEAVKHDRVPLNGRPMFLSRYTATKSTPTFKYPTAVERNKLFVKNLPFSHCTKEALTEIFDKHGALKDVRVVTFKDGKPKGLAYIEYEDEASANTALEKTTGLLVADRKIDVAISAPPPKKDAGQASLGLPKRDTGGGMRRTQLSSFIPSVLQKASTSNGNGSANGDKRPLSNHDFRNLLLKK
ncbi:squamous cell carcinoma antigen recognized by T-cells 3 [Pieris brassicae]|uniref:squamous cell carcinoma antigen recognized by T-cells 3 n=1 Tax=Pieris brassicae TaxID=7116 RepID=UPI001E6612F6|nr:squamous cell carcinoma antigen recognized by T-cells 3 [Pieris brassicae]